MASRGWLGMGPLVQSLGLVLALGYLPQPTRTFTHSLLRTAIPSGQASPMRNHLSYKFGVRQQSRTSGFLRKVSMTGRTALVYNEQHAPHNGWGHPEQPARVEKMWEVLEEEGLMAKCDILTPRVATEEELLSVHSAEHVHGVLEGRPEPDPSTYFGKKSAPAASMAAGSVVTAMEAVCSGEATNAFCAVRPPGHHAERTRMMGFCIFNSVAVAAQQAKERFGKKRILIYDWDVHHGNGIQNIFYEDPEVLYISVHRGGMDQSYFYPCTGTAQEVGKGAGRGFNVNVPLECAGSGDSVYKMAMERVVEPIAKSFQPDLVIVSAGFDAVAGDPLGGMMVSPKMFGQMTKRMMEIAPQGQLVLALEGGYNVDITAECALECVNNLIGAEIPEEGEKTPNAWEMGALEHTQRDLDRVVEIQKEFWPVA